jgi:hypothetical protein
MNTSEHSQNDYILLENGCVLEVPADSFWKVKDTSCMLTASYYLSISPASEFIEFFTPLLLHATISCSDEQARYNNLSRLMSSPFPATPYTHPWRSLSAATAPSRSATVS